MSILFSFFLYLNPFLVFFFFFQAEDGIRDFHVTGVQTCALPISNGPADDGVAPGAVAEGVGSAADAEAPRDGAIDDHERRARMGRRLDREEVEARLGHRA